MNSDQASANDGLEKTKKRVFVEIFALFILTRFVLTIVGVIARTRFPDLGTFYSSLRAFDIWGSWDTGWYLEIARNNYSWIMPDGVVGASYAFAPLFPLLIKVLHFFSFGIISYYLCGLLVVNFAFVTALFLFYGYIDKFFGQQIAFLSVVTLICAPMSFVFSAVLSEAPFLLLSITFFLVFMKKSGLWQGYPDFCWG